MFFTLPKDTYTSGLRRVCDIEKAENGWVITVYKDISPTTDEMKTQMRGFGNIMKYFQSQTPADEPWKQADYNEEDAASAVTDLASLQKRPLETHLFLQKEELLAFLVKLL